MKGAEIFLSVPQAATRWEGIPGAAMFPGICVQVRPGQAAPSQGRFIVDPYETDTGSDGDPRELMILDYDWAQGFTALSQILQNAAAGGTGGMRALIRTPAVGEECNLLAAGQVGTGSANVLTIGTRLIRQHATGKFIPATGSTQIASAVVLERIAMVPDTDTLVWCKIASNI